MKIYTKQQSVPYISDVRATSNVRASHDSPLRTMWNMILKRKIMLFSLVFLAILLPILYLVIRYPSGLEAQINSIPPSWKQPKIETAWPAFLRRLNPYVAEPCLKSLIMMGIISALPSKYFVYLLKSLVDGNYYIGQTDNIEKRLKEHNDGKVKSTKSRRPLELIGYEEYKTRNEARWNEYQYKHHSDKKKKFIEKLLTKI